MSLLLLALSSPTWAAECEPLDEGEFRELVVQLQAGIDRADEGLPPAVIAEVHERVPCLEFAPEPRMWAQFLVGDAVVAFARGEPWEASLAAALRIYPEVDRGVSSRHPLSSWEPPAPPEPGPELPEDAGIYVDGLPATHAPPEQGLYLVQRTDGRFWNSLLVHDGGLPEGWLTDRVVPPPHLASWFGVSLLTGLASVFQRHELLGNWVQQVEAAGSVQVATGLALDGQATFSSPFGVRGGGSVWMWDTSPGADVHVAGIWTWRALVVGAGGGITAVDTWEGAADGGIRRVHLLRYVHLAAELRGGRRTRWHLAMSGGSSINCTRGVSEAHLAFPEGKRKRGRWRIGVVGETTTGSFQRQGAPRDLVDAGSNRVSLRLGRVWGEY